MYERVKRFLIIFSCVAVAIFFIYFIFMIFRVNKVLGREENAIDEAIETQVPTQEESTTEETSLALAKNQKIGKFKTVDIFGEEITEEIFSENKLTLVNVFTTWCPPCVKEMPELEELNNNFANSDVAVVGICLDTRTFNGEIDTEIVETAKDLKNSTGVNFPYIIPDETFLDKRLLYVESVPTSFFVDSKGVIVGDIYYGAYNLENWTEIVNKELENIG
ncbi:MAG: TlpA disulfide reductase family protein [Lachnospirales bacterium]